MAAQLPPRCCAEPSCRRDQPIRLVRQDGLAVDAAPLGPPDPENRPRIDVESLDRPRRGTSILRSSQALSGEMRGQTGGYILPPREVMKGFRRPTEGNL
jgi:hypothetical protein